MKRSLIKWFFHFKVIFNWINPGFYYSAIRTYYVRLRIHRRVTEVACVREYARVCKMTICTRAKSVSLIQIASHISTSRLSFQAQLTQILYQSFGWSCKHWLRKSYRPPVGNRFQLWSHGKCSYLLQHITNVPMFAPYRSWATTIQEINHCSFGHWNIMGFSTYLCTHGLRSTNYVMISLWISRKKES